MARKERRAEAEKELPGVREMLSAAVERARGSEAERDRHRLVLILFFRIRRRAFVELLITNFQFTAMVVLLIAV